MKFFSVCSGIEAASVAWKPLGWDCVGVSEIEKFPAAVLAHHYPDVKNFGDMTKLLERPDFNDTAFNVLVGGTPCQSFSVAGLRKGLADPRGNLALHFLKLLDSKRPRWMVWENVPGVLSSWSDEASYPASEESRRTLDDAREEGDRLIRELSSFLGEDTEAGRAAVRIAFDDREAEEIVQSSDFDTFTSGLRELGYDIAWRVLDAQFFGVPQRRRRVFVVGYLGDWRRAVAVLFERASLRGDSPPRREARQGPTDGVAHSLRAGGFDASEDGTGRGTPLVPASPAEPQKPIVIDRAAFNQGQGAQYEPKIEETETMPSLVARGPHAVLGKNEPVPILEAGARTGKSTTDARAGAGIGEPGDPMFTLQAGKQHAIGFGGNDSGQDALEELAPTLRAGTHSKSHANGGVPPAVVITDPTPIDMRQASRGATMTNNRAAGSSGGAPGTGIGEAGDPSPTIAASHVPAVVYENHAQDSRVTECEVSPQINAKAGTGGGNLPLAISPVPQLTEPVVFEPRFARNGRGAPDEVCPPLKAQSGETGKGDGAPVVAFTQNSRSEVRQIGGDGQIVGALAAEPGAQQQNYVAYQSGGGVVRKLGDVSGTLDSARESRGTNQQRFLANPTAVRRLTPRECERLQGFPDDYTAIPWGQHKADCASILDAVSEDLGDDPTERDDVPCDCGKPPKPAPDGPRYKSLGNSMAVVVMSWIGKRVKAVEDLMKLLDGLNK